MSQWVSCADFPVLVQCINRLSHCNTIHCETGIHIVWSVPEIMVTVMFNKADAKTILPGMGVCLGTQFVIAATGRGHLTEMTHMEEGFLELHIC